MTPRSKTVSDLIDDHIKGSLSYSDLHLAIHKLGYKTTSLYEMVIGREYELGPIT